MLSNVNIKDALREGLIRIDGLQESAIQPASVDLHLAKEFIIPREHYEWGGWAQDPYKQEDIDVAFGSVHNWDEFVLGSLEFALAATSEVVCLGNEIAAEVSGKSSLARLGLVVHVTAGFIDPGFEGPITLELFNCSPNAILLTPGMPIAQLVFTRLDTPASPGYAGKYVGATGPQVSMYWKNERPQVIHKEGQV